MYDPQAVLEAIDAHKVGVVALAGAALVCNYVWFVEAYRVARRHRSYSIPLFCTCFWFAHDASFVFAYEQWFDVYDHWFPKLFWVGLVVTTVFELFFIAQVVRYARAEHAPGMDPRAFAAAFGAVLAGAMVIWIIVKETFDDPLYLISLGLATAAYAPFGMAMVLRRGSRRGQSPLMWKAFLGTCVGWFTASTLWFGPEFRGWRWLALGAVTTIWSAATLVLVQRAPDHSPEETGVSPSATPPADAPNPA